MGFLLFSGLFNGLFINIYGLSYLFLDPCKPNRLMSWFVLVIKFDLGFLMMFGGLLYDLMILLVFLINWLLVNFLDVI